MAIEKNDLNTLNNIQISTNNDRAFYSDVRSLIFFTKEFNIEPTFITNASDVLGLSIEGLDENNNFYKLIRSAYTQNYTPINVVIYGNKTATSFTQLIKSYEDNEKAFECTNWITVLNLANVTEKAYIESIVEYAKTDKEKQFAIGIEYEKLSNITLITELQKNSNADNVCFIVEGSKNVANGQYLTGAFFGGTVGYKALGSWAGHSTKVDGFVQENFTKIEQKTFWDNGLNYLSKPTRGYFHLVNGMNSNNKTFIELKLVEIWLRDKLKKDMTILQVTKDKIPINDQGKALVTATILEVCRIGASEGMFMTDENRNYFGTISQKDKNGNTIKIKLGELTVKELNQESLREGKFDFDLKLTYLNSVRYVSLKGTVDTDGELIFEN